MLRRNIDAKAEATKLASLSIVWGVGAAVAYLGLIHRGIDLIGSSASALGLSADFDHGLIAAASSSSGSSQSLLTVAIAAVPIAIIAVLVLGFFARVRPTLTALPVGMIIASVVGLAGSIGLLLSVVNTSSNRQSFIAALVTIVLVSLLLRISRGVRRFYRRNPGLVSAIVGVVSIGYLFLLNAVSIPSILLTNLDFWLAPVAFGIVLYSAINMIGLGMRARRGK